MVDSIYREIILDHFRNPRNKGTLDPNDYTYEDTNPLCGDEVRIDLRVSAEGIVTAVTQQGRGCAVSQAAASILTEMVDGKPLDEVKALTKDDLLDEENVAVRAGHHCCQPLMEILGVVATTRASFYLYNTHDDVDCLVAGLGRVRQVFALPNSGPGVQKSSSTECSAFKARSTPASA